MLTFTSPNFDGHRPTLAIILTGININTHLLIDNDNMRYACQIRYSNHKQMWTYFPRKTSLYKTAKCSNYNKIESGDCEDISGDSHQDQPTQRTLASDSLVRKTLAKTYTVSTRGRGKDGRREISEEDATTLLSHRNRIYPVSLQSSRLEIQQGVTSLPALSRAVIHSVEVNSTDRIVPRSVILKATAAMASTATEATAPRHRCAQGAT